MPIAGRETRQSRITCSVDHGMLAFSEEVPKVLMERKKS
jgi:hypothetical protein